MTALRFWRGNRLYQVAPAHSGDGFIGICGGRIAATAPDRAGVVRALILSDRWRSRQPAGTNAQKQLDICAKTA